MHRFSSCGSSSSFEDMAMVCPVSMSCYTSSLDRGGGFEWTLTSNTTFRTEYLYVEQ
jgi:hypothetical protein